MTRTPPRRRRPLDRPGGCPARGGATVVTALAGLVGLALTVPAVAADAAYVLPPTAAEKIQAAFAAATPAWRLRQGDVARDRVTGKALTPDGVEVTFTLDRDGPACTGRHAGSFCLGLDEGATDAHADALAEALARVPGADVWLEVRARDGASAPAVARPRPDEPRARHRPGDKPHDPRYEGQRRGATVQAAAPLDDHGAVLMAFAAGLIVGGLLLLWRRRTG